MAKPKKILKIIGGIIIFLSVPTLLLFGFLYFKYNEKLPIGKKGEAAEQLATKMLKSLDYEAYQNTNYIEWTFKNRHLYKWNKAENSCEVYWKNCKVILQLNNLALSEVFEDNLEIEDVNAKEYVDKAILYFNNDSFWLVAPYKIFDAGTERSLITLDNGEKALLVTYKSGGSTPGDSYLWHLDASGKPTSFQMWVDILPIGGLEATWNDWTTTESGAQLPTFHKLMVLGLEITDIVGM